MIILGFLLSFGGALLARLACRHWQVWPVWLGFSALGASAIMAAGHPAGPSLFFTAGASGAGFIAPELWCSFRAWVRRERSYAWLMIFIAGIVTLAFLPQLLVQLAGIVAMLYGIKVMFTGLKPNKKSGRKK
ncbi:MAG: hypothetical protein Q8Q06_03285 [bacterium]|nr:hypothetical protein [bacterium]